MLAIVFYILKVIVCSGIFMGYYWCFLRNGRFYNWNRFYMLFATLTSIFIPLITIPIYVFEANQIVVPFVEEEAFESVGQVMQGGTKLSITAILTSIYLLTIAILFFVEFKSLWTISRLRKNAQLNKIGNVKIYSISDDSAPFTFFNVVF